MKTQTEKQNILELSKLAKAYPKKYMVLVDYENTIQGEMCLVAHNLTLDEALNKKKELIDEQNAGNIDEDYIIHDVNGKGIYIVEYTLVHYDF